MMASKPKGTISDKLWLKKSPLDTFDRGRCLQYSFNLTGSITQVQVPKVLIKGYMVKDSP